MFHHEHVLWEINAEPTLRKWSSHIKTECCACWWGDLIANIFHLRCMMSARTAHILQIFSCFGFTFYVGILFYIHNFLFLLLSNVADKIKAPCRHMPVIGCCCESRVMLFINLSINSVFVDFVNIRLIADDGRPVGRSVSRSLACLASAECFSVVIEFARWIYLVKTDQISWYRPFRLTPIIDKITFHINIRRFLDGHCNILWLEHGCH